MIRVCVICEGHTEAAFVRTCLEPHLRGFGVLAYPSLLKTRPGKQGGGRVTVERVAKHMQHEYRHADRLTTLLDFYGFANVQGRNKAVLEQDILLEVARLVANFNPQRVLPYVQRYEFEGLLFTDVEQFQWVLEGWNPEARAALMAVRQAFDTPEDINNSQVTAPSKRILKIFDQGQYSKVEHGPLIASEIGLPRIRQACPQFDAWLGQLEALGPPSEVA